MLVEARQVIPYYLRIWILSTASVILGFFLVWASITTTLTGFPVEETRADGLALIIVPFPVVSLMMYVASVLVERTMFKGTMTRDFWKRLE